MSGEKPSIGSLWQDNSTKRIHRVISIFADNSSFPELIEYQDVQHGNGFRGYHVASHWHEAFTLVMSSNLPSIGSHWQHDIGKVYRVIRVLKGAKSLHGAELIEHQDVESGEYYARLANEWHEYFTLISENPSIFSYWRHIDTGVMCRVIRVLKGAKSLHGVDLIEYQDVESAEYYVRFVSEWHEYFTPVIFGKE